MEGHIPWGHNDSAFNRDERNNPETKAISRAAQKRAWPPSIMDVKLFGPLCWLPPYTALGVAHKTQLINELAGTFGFGDGLGHPDRRALLAGMVAVGRFTGI
ncbi:hypothetical protein [Micromonospora sp. NPDC002575]|uniref:hypothetical protein n=1 Tax=Micromonospora sp. NPDC002575 TaxID=3364222 RepID=UPI0036C18D24